MTESSAPPPSTLTPYLRRITLILAALVGVTWILGAFAITQLERVQDKSRDINEQALQSTLVLGQMAADLNAFRIQEARLTRGASGDDRVKGLAELGRLEARVEANSRIFESLDNSDDEMRLFMRFLTDWRNYFTKAWTLAQSPPPANSASSALLESKPPFEDGRLALGQLIRINVEQGKMAMEEAEQIYRTSMTLIITAMVLTTMIITGMLLLVIRHEAR